MKLVLLALLDGPQSVAVFQICVMILLGIILGILLMWYYMKSRVSDRSLRTEFESFRNTVIKDQKIQDETLVKHKESLVALESSVRVESAINEKQNIRISALEHLEPAAHAEVLPAVKLEPSSNKQTAALQNVASKKHLINFSSIGTASEADKDDLKLISGIGPFIEKKLNALDIWTFKQVASFTTNDVDSVTEAIEFFPGRITRDNWVEQAANLVKQ